MLLFKLRPSLQCTPRMPCALQAFSYRRIVQKGNWAVSAIPHLCLQFQYFQNVIDLPWNVIHSAAFQLFVDFAPEGQIIRQPTIRREKGSVGKEDSMLPQKLLTEQSFIDAGPVKPCGPFPIRQFFLPGNGRCPPCFFSPHNHAAHKLCRLSETLVAPVPAVPNHRQSENPERN